MRRMGEATRYPGVYRIDDSTHRIRAKVTDPRSGRTRWIERLLQGVSTHEAAKERAALVRDEQALAGPTQQQRVGDYAERWLRSKATRVDWRTAEVYGAALEKALPALGDYRLDGLRASDIQAWVDEGLRQGYAVPTVHGWFRVLRTMLKDAVADCDLPRDPTLRVQFPTAVGRPGNALTPKQLAKFLVAVKKGFPHHYALAATLAYTGLRFCHASALRWEDIDWSSAVVHVRRKQVMGRVGAVSAKKRAPAAIPLHEGLAATLRAHLEQMTRDQAPGLAEGWCFPSRAGTLRQPSGLRKAWEACLAEAGVRGRFTPHGLRRTFNDLARLAGVDSVVTRAMTGHVTESMREHYSTVGMDERRTAVNSLVNLVGTRVGTEGRKASGRRGGSPNRP